MEVGVLLVGVAETEDEVFLHGPTDYLQAEGQAVFEGAGHRKGGSADHVGQGGESSAGAEHLRLEIVLCAEAGLVREGRGNVGGGGEDEEVNGGHQFQEVLPHHLSEPQSLVVGLGGDEAAEEQGYPHVVVVLMELRATDARVMDGCSFQVGDGAGDGSSVKNAGEGDFLHGSAPVLEDFSSLEDCVPHLRYHVVAVDFFSDDADAQAAGVAVEQVGVGGYGVSSRYRRPWGRGRLWPAW